MIATEQINEVIDNFSFPGEQTGQSTWGNGHINDTFLLTYQNEDNAKMMGGDLSTMRNAFRPAAEKQAKINVTLTKLIEVEGITVTEEDLAAEYAELAKTYEMEIEKIKEMVPEAEIKAGVENRKAVKVIVDSAVAVAPKAEEKTEE